MTLRKYTFFGFDSENEKKADHIFEIARLLCLLCNRITILGMNATKIKVFILLLSLLELLVLL